MNTTNLEPIRLTKSGWWCELSEVHDTLPGALVAHLRGLISATLNNTIPPHVDRRLLELAKLHLQKGLYIGEDYYQFLLFEPDNPAQNYHILVMVKTYPGGVLRSLEQAKFTEG